MDEIERSIAGQNKVTDRWSRVAVTRAERENADTLAQCRAKWSAIYGIFGASNEQTQDEVFAAVNMYFLVNGCSPKGKYGKNINTAGGLTEEVGKVVKIIGRLDGEIRQFMRGRLLDSYTFLKYNPAIAADPSLTSAAENVGVPKNMAWLMADWLGRDCEYFVGDESDVYNRLRTSKIQAAYVKNTSSTSAVDKVKELAPETGLSPALINVRKSNVSHNGDLF